jgi:cytochrome c-type biogenesis protein CcmH
MHGQDLSKLLSGEPGDTVSPAAQSSQADPSKMIHAMVDKLAAELKANPRNEQGWSELMRAQMVLGETDAAKAAYRDAMITFADAPAKQAELRRVAQALHVPGV